MRAASSPKERAEQKLRALLLMRESELDLKIPPKKRPLKAVDELVQSIIAQFLLVDRDGCSVTLSGC